MTAKVETAFQGRIGCCAAEMAETVDRQQRKHRYALPAAARLPIARANSIEGHMT
jgi:hypothetical protein